MALFTQTPNAELDVIDRSFWTVPALGRQAFFPAPNARRLPLFSVANSKSRLSLGMADESGLEESWFTNGDIRLHAVAAGPQDGPIVILLHGFPEFWYGWHNQIAPLADAGFRVIAPDQRGYNTSSKPAGIAAYKVSQLTSDVIAIVDQIGKDRVHVVGHDWGALIAWSVAMQHPDRVIRLAILKVPHPVVLQHNIRTNPRQWLKSWYALFFQIAWLPEFRSLRMTSGWQAVARPQQPFACVRSRRSRAPRRSMVAFGSHDRDG